MHSIIWAEIQYENQNFKAMPDRPYNFEIFTEFPVVAELLGELPRRRIISEEFETVKQFDRKARPPNI